ncbi:MAG: Calx-beta domain-containing protein [Candidatus Electronema sp. V4]|uniref:Calx-beta domain-containing protein n=1 Tax=Candidatus Electronema sp. V4 TaxID=3454756 RepID=UPI00405580D3
MKKQRIAVLTATLLIAGGGFVRSAYSDKLLLMLPPILAKKQTSTAVLTLTGGSVTEGDSGTKQLEFTLSLDGFYESASVDYATQDGTATAAGNDYLANSGTVNFTGGATSQKVSVTINGDTDVEPNETFSLALSKPVNLTLGNTGATGTIVNDDSTGMAVLTLTGGSVTEGDSGTKQLEFILSLDGFYESASVDYATQDGTATAAGNDYLANSGTVNFTGGATSQKVSVTINGDTDVEPNETFSLALSKPVNMTLGNTGATGTIVNDDSTGTAVLTLTGGSVTEGDSGTKQLEFTLSLNAFYGAASVDYTTQNGTATAAGNDYLANSGTVNFTGGATSQKVSVTINGDTDVEPNETFSLVLSKPVNMTLGNTGATGTITNDDSAKTTGALNDTGVTWSGRYDSGNNTTCVSSSIPVGDNVVAAQDCSHGRDATHNDNSDGQAGFSYTKLDSSGQPLANQQMDYTATPWACVRDNVTGLTWEVKTDDGGLHDKDDAYTWYNTNPTTNGGINGTDGAGNSSCYGYASGNSASYCNTQAYVNRVNAAGLCGANDWRMPTVKELESLWHYGRGYPDMAIDSDYFPNTMNHGFWSGLPFANNPAWYNKDYAWYVQGYADVSACDDIVNRFKIRLVRSVN